MAAPAILAEGLLKRYDDLVAVDRCSFVVEEGEVFGFLGPNGAGKSSIMRMIACVSPTTGGRLEVFGMAVDEHPREIKALIGVVSQENNLDPDLSLRLMDVFMQFNAYGTTVVLATHNPELIRRNPAARLIHLDDGMITHANWPGARLSCRADACDLLEGP